MRYQFTLLLLLCAAGTRAQQPGAALPKRNMDSIRLSYMKLAALRYPALRQGFVSTEVIGKGKMRSELYGKDFFEGDANIIRTRANFTVPVYQKGKSVVTTTFNYLGQSVQIDKVTNLDSRFTVAPKQTYKSTITGMASYKRADTLFGKPMNFAFSISASTDGNFSATRINYLGIVIVPVKKTQMTTVSVGAMMVIDPTSLVPVIPFFSYWHQFKKPGFELFIDLPSRIMARKQLSAKTALMLGSELGGNLAFMNITNRFFPQESIYTTLEIKSGPTFEYQLQKNLVLGISAGLFTTATSRIFEKTAGPNDYFINNKVSSVPYANVTLSLLPFMQSILR